MLHLHLGIDIKHLNNFLRRANNFQNVVIDGDGWNAWGESVGSNGNDPRTIHVIIPVSDVGMVTSEVLDSTMLTPNPDGYLAILTQADNWQTISAVWRQSHLGVRMSSPMAPELEKALGVLYSGAMAFAEENLFGEAYETLCEAYETLCEALINIKEN